MPSTRSDRRTKAELLGDIEDLECFKAALEEELEREHHRYRTKHGITKAQGRELVSLHQKLKAREAKIAEMGATNSRLSMQVDAATSILWRVAGLHVPRTTFGSAKGALPELVSDAKRAVTAIVQRPKR